MLNKVIFLFFDLFAWILARAPKFIIYRIADIIYFLFYHISHYRRKVVSENLKNAFPEKSDQERKTIEKKFYRHLSDITIENFIFLKMSKKRLEKFVTVINPEIYQPYYQNERSVVGILGHYGNWEAFAVLQKYVSHQILSVYKKLKNKVFDQRLYDLRSKFGALPVTMQDALKKTLEHIKNHKPVILGLLTDQCPLRKSIGHWNTFLNQETPHYIGPEKIAKKLNAPVVFGELQKVKRGYYEITFHLLFEEPKNTKPNEITNKQASFLESIIVKKPEYWLWSHKRWKHKKLTS